MTEQCQASYTLETDVLIIGGGFAGLWAAMAARRKGADVLIVDKGPRDWGGLGRMCGGDLIAYRPGNDLDAMVDELVYYFDGLCDQDVVRTILQASEQRFDDYERMGHRFARNAEGKLLSIPQRGLDHIRCYLYRPYGLGGEDKANTLVQQVEALGVHRIGRVQITEILKSSGCAVGAVGFHVQSGLSFVFKSRTVILAANMGSWKTSYHINSNSGEGCLLAYEAGVTLRNCEFLRIWNVPMLFAWEGQTGLLPKGARFLNRYGEDFMKRYSPVLGAKADPHYNIRGMAMEIRAGRGPIYFDCSRMKREDIDIMRPAGGWMKLNDTKLLAEGIDFFRQQIEWMPMIRESFGGAVTKMDGRTNVDGLFVAGRARSVEQGVYMGGWAMCVTATTGHMTGSAAADYAMDMEKIEPEDGAVRDALKRMLLPLGEEGIMPKDIMRETQRLMFPADVTILRTGRGLTRSLEGLQELKDAYLPRMKAPSPHYLMKYYEAASMVLMTELYLRSALMRKESRSGHYREDYPSRNDADWLCWIHVSKDSNGSPQLMKKTVPIWNYPVKPYRYYMDNFDFSDKSPAPQAGAYVSE